MRGESGSLDHLLLTLYRSIHASNPWTEFLELLCRHLQACTATLVLRQPSRGDRGVLFDVNTRRSVVEVYRTQVFADDPFLDLGEGIACNIFDRVSREGFLRSRFYNELLKLDEVCDILALNVTFGNTYLGSLKLARRDPDECFQGPEKALLKRLYPHIKLAMESYERSHREDLESNAYVRAIDQLAFGVIILNEREHVIRINETAARMLSASKLLQVAGNKIQAGEPGHQAMLTKALRAMYESAGADGRGTSSLKLSAGSTPAGSSAASLHLLLKPITATAGGEGPGWPYSYPPTTCIVALRSSRLPGSTTSRAPRWHWLPNCSTALRSLKPPVRSGFPRTPPGRSCARYSARPARTASLNSRDWY